MPFGPIFVRPDRAFLNSTYALQSKIIEKALGAHGYQGHSDSEDDDHPKLKVPSADVFSEYERLRRKFTVGCEQAGK